ncbi:hypothetical protein [Microvirga sesbaniae]|uniref:hypothetical protein n=1 Tax=Microvirga sesbaniae TaxID=681392 RepID=UPI0021C92C45|nr:hypothetical protein [Microvirga sp. HBU67692]
MATVIYRDRDRTAPRVTWQGIEFLDGQAVAVDDPALLAKAEANPFFEIAGEAPAPRRGRAAKAVTHREVTHDENQD